MLLSKELNIAGKIRTYQLFIPDRRSKENNFLILSLHGAGGSSDISIYETGLIDRADRDGFIVTFPDALPGDTSKTADFKNNPRIWQAKPIDGIESPDLLFLSELIKLLRLELKVDNVFATGFSNGAIMCSYLALKNSDILSAVAPVCGKLVTPEIDDKIIPTLLIIGDSDPLFPLSGGKVNLLWGKTMNVQPIGEYIAAWIDQILPPREVSSIKTNNFNSISYINSITELNIVTIFNHGHIWPGGKSKLTYRIVGNPNRNVSANDLMLNFFKKHSK